MKIAILGLALGLGVLGCGGSNSQCGTGNCPSPSTKTYQVCASQGSSVTTENYGGQTCQIDVNNPQSASSMACSQAIAAWCAMP
ncbi:MAG TPA: hypothetical protein VFF06_04660 [Polyangia bacterium]|nr:hypothetical protein [Polyangia bacterium]